MPRNADQAAMSPPMTPAPIDMYMTKFGGRFTAQALQPILQQEHAHQISRSRRAHEFADGSCLRFVTLGCPRRHGAATGRRWRRAPGTDRAARCDARSRWSALRRTVAPRPRFKSLSTNGAVGPRRRRQQPCLGALAQRRRGHEFVDQAHRQSARTPVGLAFEHEIQRRAHADELHASAPCRRNPDGAEQHFGQPQRQARHRRRRPGRCRRARVPVRRPERSRAERQRSGRADPRASAERTGPARINS